MKKFERYTAGELTEKKAQLERKADFHYGAMQECKAQKDAEFFNEHRELWENLCSIITDINYELSQRA